MSSPQPAPARAAALPADPAGPTCPAGPAGPAAPQGRTREIRRAGRRRAARRLAVVPLAVAVALAGTGCLPAKKKRGSKRSPRTVPSSRPAGARPGTAVPGRTAGSVTRVGKSYLVRPDSRSRAIVQLASYRKLPGDGGSMFPPENGGFVVFTLRIKAVRGSVHWNPLYVKLRTPAGKLLDTNDGNGNYVEAEPEVRPGDIPAGRVITTAVALDGRISPGTRLVYTNTLDRAIASWRL